MVRIITPFGFRSTATEVVEGINLTEERAIVAVRSSTHMLSQVVFDDIHLLFAVAPYALNPENADRLWEESLYLIA